ncbi:MAG: hypothetical protein E6K78_04280 [Candidatus Eisenbacteria bacterium]|uniref:DUF1761 domain-containing protein n=1 Tax=Eiseniibacteriota bacterium TaxID=2212470 RepID=A0A538TVE7_UNCEI|nr:MAG: hypothetical protein E6K78_04280 [Candidatus Eisenbacteria bacterium]
MVPIMSLWMPILLSAVFSFLASWLIHMMLGYHKNDYRKVPAEDQVMDALRPFDLPPGDYMVPRVSGPAEMKSPAFAEKMKRGPVLIATVLPNGMWAMAPQLAQWFVYCVVIGVFAAYVAGRALAPGAPYLSVFRFAGTTTFACFGVALWQDSIWYKRSWATTAKHTLDSLIYGLLAGGTFGWLWPR